MDDSLKNKILLIDNSINVDSINFDSEFNEIITLDYLSHEKLQNKKIKHTVSDIFISDSEFKNLDQLSHDFLKWHDNSEIKNLITYKNINLGKLFDLDLYLYLLPILKTFFELSKLIPINPNSIFYSSSKICNFLEQFDVEYRKLNQKNMDDEFYLDSLTYEINLNSKSLKIPISRANYKRLRPIVENFYFSLFKNKPDNLTNSHILVEFDPLKYNKLLSSFSNDSNYVIYNRRRPYIWNYSTFSILNKSTVKFFPESKLIGKHEKTFLKNSKFLLDDLVKNFNEHNDYFEKFFKVNNLSFWRIMKNSFATLCISRFNEYIKEIEMALIFFDKTDPSTITIWSETGSTEQIVISIAKSKKIPIFLLQHGIYHDDDSAINFNFFSGVLPKDSDYFLVWGNHMYEYCKKIGLNQKQIKIIGNPSFDEYEKDFSNQVSSKYILLAAQGPTNFALDDLKNSVFEKYISSIKQICFLAKKFQKHLIIKLHPDPNDLDITAYIKEEYPDVTVIKTGDMKELIQNCELFLCIDISTAILEAQLLQKPTISISVKENLGLSKSKVFEYCVRTDVNHLENYFDKIFNNLKFKNNLVLDGTKFLNEYLFRKNSASQNFINFLNNH